MLAWKTYTVVKTGNALCSTVHRLNDAVVANTSRTTAAELTPIILFELWQNFSIEMFGGNVALMFGRELIAPSQWSCLSVTTHTFQAWMVIALVIGIRMLMTAVPMARNMLLVVQCCCRTQVFCPSFSPGGLGLLWLLIPTTQPTTLCPAMILLQVRMSTITD